MSGLHSRIAPTAGSLIASLSGITVGERTGGTSSYTGVSYKTSDACTVQAFGIFLVQV